MRPAPPLVDRGFGLIYDTERDITWMQDANYAKTVGRSPDGQLTWPAAMRWVASISYGGIRGWRLPNARNLDGSGPAIGNDCAGSEMGHLFLGVFRTHPNIVHFTNSTIPCIYWTATEANPDEAFALDVFTIRQGLLWKDPWAERLVQVPLPGPFFRGRPRWRCRGGIAPKFVSPRDHADTRLLRARRGVIVTCPARRS